MPAGTVPVMGPPTDHDVVRPDHRGPDDRGPGSGLDGEHEGAGSGAYSVTEVVREIADALDRRFGGVVSVQGEVAGMQRHRNGHVYFDLVDRPEGGGSPVATLSVVLFDATKKRVNARLRGPNAVRIDDGVRIRISGRVDLYRPRGRLQLLMDDLDPTYTLGLLASDRDRVLRLLTDEGLVDRNAAVPIPMAPMRVGLVTAEGSAAEADVLTTLADSGFAWDVVAVDTRVQGAGAERQVAAALVTAARAGVDVVVLARGGGARTDLATFDHELVARTIASLPVAVVTGIGHETDRSAADAVAHRAERTPTACANALVELARHAAGRANDAWTAVSRRALDVVTTAESDATERARWAARRTASHLAEQSLHLDAASRRARRRAPEAVDAASRRIERASARAEVTARAHLRAHDERLAAAGRALGQGTRHALRHAERDLALRATGVAALDPARALARGWSITRTATGTVVRATIDVGPGDVVVTTLADGHLTSVVADTTAPTAPGPSHPLDPPPPMETTPDAP